MYDDITVAQAALGSLFGKQQDRSMAAFTEVGNKYANGKDNVVQEGGVTAAEGLNRQAKLLGEVNDALSGIQQDGVYDSEASFAAAQQQGIKKKMKALNMIDQAEEDVVYDPMVAEFIDPVTGERVSADSFDYNSDQALRRSIKNDLVQSEIEYETYAFAKDARYIADKQAKHQQPNQHNGEVEKRFEKLFGESGEELYGNWRNGRFDMYEVTNSLTNINNASRKAGYDSVKGIAKTEYEARQDGSIANADAYNTAQQYAQEKGNDQSNKAADAKAGLRQSITKDKQNLARRSAGSTGGKRKARIDYGDSGGSSRPV